MTGFLHQKKSLPSLIYSIYLSSFPSITYLDNPSVVPVFWINLAKPARPRSPTVGVWECCLRMYPNTDIVLAFFSPPIESVTIRPARASNSLESTFRECWLPFVVPTSWKSISAPPWVFFLQLQLQGVVESWRFSSTGVTYTLRWVITALWEV